MDRVSWRGCTISRFEAADDADKCLGRCVNPHRAHGRYEGARRDAQAARSRASTSSRNVATARPIDACRGARTRSRTKAGCGPVAPELPDGRLTENAAHALARRRLHTVLREQLTPQTT